MADIVQCGIEKLSGGRAGGRATGEQIEWE